jgi:hypothetical protein
MKTKLTTLLITFAATLAFGHGGVEIGPNGGRILEFSKDETMHGELILKDGKFHIGVLDKDMKPVAIADQLLTATTGDRSSPHKLEVTKTDKGFFVPVVKPGDWLILQFKLDGKAKPITARIEYNTTVCSECKNDEWMCKCVAEPK